MKVSKLTFNWCQTGNIQNGLSEDFNIFTVGKNKVTHIIENKPENGLECWNYLVNFEDGHAVRVFNPNLVEYFT